jgi:aminocarboxymuconate-semialdehyde decarboxylase
MKTIDAHAHFIPADLVADLRRGDGPDGMILEENSGVPWVVHRQGYRYPLQPHFYDLEARLAYMDRNGVTDAVLSVPPTLLLYWADAGEAADAARRINDSLSKLVADSGGRLRAIATLPMQEPDAATAELERAVVELGLCGAQVGPHIEGTTLDADGPSDVLARAADLGVTIVVHPYYVGSNAVLGDYYMTNLLGNPWQTTVCATRLIFSGTLERLERLRMLLVHGGGYLPHAAGRLDRGHAVRPEVEHLPHRPSTYLRRFHYDTLVHDPALLSDLVRRVGDDRVVLGTDTPFDMGDGPLAAQLGETDLSDESLRRISYANAELLFRRQDGS